MQRLSIKIKKAGWGVGRGRGWGEASSAPFYFFHACNAGCKFPFKGCLNSRL